MRRNILAITGLLAGALTCSASIHIEAWYHLGEPGTLAGGLPVDSSGNGNNMNDGFSEFETVHPSADTPGGPLGTSGFVSTNSSEWGRSGDVIIAARDGYYVSGDNFGIEAWVLPFGNGYNIFCCESAHDYTAQIFASGGDSTGFYLGVRRDITNETYSFVAAVITDTNGVARIGDPLPLVTNAWTHLAVVRNNGTNTFYVNGLPHGASTIDTPSTNTPTGTGSQSGMRLGASGGDQLAYRGLIDEARAFTFTLGEFSVTNLLYPSVSAATPLVVTQPADATVWNGGAVRFNVGVASSPSLSYQWQRGSLSSILGGTSSSLFLPSVALSSDNQNTYRCFVTNTSTSAFTVSSNATLTVVAVQTNNQANYEALVVSQPALVAYFPVDGNTGSTLSNVKTPANAGTLEGNASYDGRTDRSFGQRALALDRNNNLGDVMLANDPDYFFPGGVGTIEAIVYMKENGVYINSGNWSFPTIFSIAEPDTTSPQALIGVSKVGDALEYSLDGTAATTLSWPVPKNLVGRFAHIALVFDQASGVTAYADGHSLSTQGSFSPAFTTSPAWIGSNGSYTNSFTGPVWSGTIDEVAIYTNALSASTIVGHYAMFAYGTNTPPVILSAPSSVIIFSGAANNTATFSVTAEGTLPLSYQWLSNTVPITGATSTSLTISNVTTSSSATYSVKVTNPVNSTNVAATLSVVTPSGYPAVVIADNPVGYWRLGEAAGPTALDSWGTNNGTFVGVETFGLPGAIAGDSNTSVDFSGNGSSLVMVPYSSSLNGGRDPNGSWTVECWVNPDLDAATEGFAVPVASVNLAANRSGYFFLEQPDGWQLRLGNSSGYLAGWNGAAGSVGGTPQAQTWYHLVGAYDGAGGNGYIYVNGVQVKSAAVSGLAQNTAATFNIGDRGDGAPFAGRIDEVAVYTGVLAAARVQAHYAAAQAPKITVTRTGSTITLSWPSGVLYQANDVNGQYTAVGHPSPYSVTPTGARKFYLLRAQ
jgi:hypothetical protein